MILGWSMTWTCYWQVLWDIQRNTIREEKMRLKESCYDSDSLESLFCRGTWDYWSSELLCLSHTHTWGRDVIEDSGQSSILKMANDEISSPRRAPDIKVLNNSSCQSAERSDKDREVRKKGRRTSTDVAMQQFWHGLNHRAHDGIFWSTGWSLTIQAQNQHEMAFKSHFTSTMRHIFE